MQRAASEVRTLARGEYLFRRGDPARAVFAVESGRLRLVRTTAAGREVTLYVARAGSLLAEAALFAERYHCDAIATVRSAVRVLPREELLRGLAAASPQALELLRRLASEVRRLRALLELRTIRAGSERLLAYVELQADDGGRLEVGLLKDLASEVGLTPEACSRALHRLERRGLLVHRDHALVLATRRKI